MFAGHQDATRRSTHGIAAIMLRQPHALLGQTVEIGRSNQLLAEAADFAVTQIVGQKEDDVWFDRFGGD